MSRIYSIDFFKLFFAYLIAYSHFGINLPGANIAVVFFFIISGFFLARKYYAKSHSFSKEKVYNEKTYTIDHIKSLYPHYIFSLILMFGYYIVKNIYYILIQSDAAKTLSDLVTDLYELIPELFLLQNVGFFNGGMNYPLWQVCALLICGYFIYALLCYNERLSTTVIFPLSIILIQVYLMGGSDPFGTVGPIYIPLIRAFSSMSIGVIAYKFTQSIYYQTIITKYSLILNLSSVVALFSIFYFGPFNNISLITSVVIILALVNRDSWINLLLNRKFFRNFGDFSYAIYLNHALIIWIVEDFTPEIINVFNIQYTEWKWGILFGMVLTLYSILTMTIVKKLKEK